MLQTIRLAVLIVLVANVTACDYMNGVTRYARVGDITLPIECILNATQAAPDINNVELRIEKGGRELTWSGLQKAEELHYFFYEYKGLKGNFYFRTDYKGASEFRHTYIMINATPPQEDIDTIRVAMTAIEAAITDSCSIQVSPPQLVENCHGVVCE